jgi:hypothetical protein
MAIFLLVIHFPDGEFHARCSFHRGGTNVVHCPFDAIESLAKLPQIGWKTA